MFLINVTSPMTMFLMVILTSLLIFLGQELKKSIIAILPLIAHLMFLVMHTVQLLTLAPEYSNFSGTLAGCLIVDFLFILISFFAYLWVDDIEAKELNKKSLDNSLDWFWKKI